MRQAEHDRVTGVPNAPDVADSELSTIGPPSLLEVTPPLST
jgi:hypothetical protein